jgi:hypothetical protein
MLDISNFLYEEPADKIQMNALLSERTLTPNTKITQDHNYRFRGKELMNMNLYEYTAMILEKVKKNDEDDIVVTGAGRKRLQGYDYDRDHPHYSTKIQVLATKWSIPCIAGKSFPCWPSNKKDNAKQKRWAEMVAVTFIPWGKETTNIDCSYKNIVKILRCWKNGTKIERLRYQLVYNMSKGMQVQHSIYKLYAEYRNQSAHCWSKDDQILANDNGRDLCEDIMFSEYNLDTFENLQNLPSYVEAKEFVENSTKLIDLIPKPNTTQTIQFQNHSVGNLTNIIFNLKHHENVSETITTPWDSIPFNGTTTEPISLSEEQTQAKDYIVRQYQNNKQVLIILHGGPGTGKSTTVNAILDELPINSSLCCAPTGIAATLLKNGKTINSLLKIPPSASSLPKIKEPQLLQLQIIFKNVKLLIIDEISMVDYSMMYRIHARLQQIYNNLLPFGGISIVGCGDFYQLPPVQGQPWQNTFLVSTNAKKNDLVFLKSQELMEKFLMIDLKVQNRSKDEQHNKNLNICRQNNTNALNVLKSYQTLSRDDSIFFSESTMLVCSNEERQAINIKRGKLLSLQIGHPLIAWKKPPASRNLASSDVIDNIYQNYTASWHYFIPLAPAIILQNFNVNLCIANGTSGLLHSLMLNPLFAEEDETRIRNAAPGTIVVIHPPECVNIELNSVLHSKMSPNWPTDAKLAIDGKLVVPFTLQDSLDKTEIKIQKTTYSFQSFGFDLSFAVTFHKSQGQTMGNVVLDVRKAPKLLGILSFASFYVGLSRVRSGSNIRLLPYNDQKSINYLCKLKPNPKINEWLQKYKPIGENSFVKIYQK